MSRSWSSFLNDIVWACNNILEFTTGMSQDAFVRDRKTFWATVKMIEIIREAARNIPAEVQQKLPDVEWANMTATRNVFAHAYFGIDDENLWDIIQTDIPELLEDLHRPGAEDEYVAYD
jgi:uncharacterized protein with HEPN domain